MRTPNGSGGRRQELREFRTFSRDLVRLREWLVAEGVTQVAKRSSKSSAMEVEDAPMDVKGNLGAEVGQNGREDFADDEAL